MARRSARIPRLLDREVKGNGLFTAIDRHSPWGMLHSLFLGSHFLELLVCSLWGTPCATGEWEPRNGECVVPCRSVHQMSVLAWLSRSRLVIRLPGVE